ncbi:MAG: hypothetical protein QNK37_08600 [Acidobacteriota bacterium]|nr:hypothetical protein [Acidobacteriota bacterium]
MAADTDRINLLHSLAPTLDGLFSVTVSREERGRAFLYFDTRRETEVIELCRDLKLAII